MRFRYLILAAAFALGFASPLISAGAFSFGGDTLVVHQATNLVNRASTILFSGGSSGGGGSTLLTTLTIQNTSGSTQATNFVTQIFGHPFKKGDIANGCSGGAPKFELTGGTNVPFSEGAAPICWTDGSLKWAPFMLRVPSTIAGSGSLTINIKSGGTTPSASSRALSDFATGSADLNVSVTGLDNLTGVWVSNLNQGVSAANSDNYVYMDGDAGKVWRVRASYRQSSADHGQLEGYWYVQALNDGSGTLGGVRYMHRMSQPWYTASAGTRIWRSFSAFTMNNGASLIRDMFSGHYGTGKTFTWTSGVTLNSTATNFDQSFGIRLTTTGSLPTGLSTGTTYFSYPINANDFALSTHSNADTFGFLQTPTGACSGTCTATAYPYLPYYASLYTTGTNAKYDYIQAGGSVAADSTTRITVNNVYWRSTKLIGPYSFGSVSPTNFAASTYYPGSAGPLERNVGTTGERPDIGPFTGWAVTHMYNQDANDEQNVRVIGLLMGAFSMTQLSKTTFTVPVVNNGHANNGTTYSGMPAVDTTFQGASIADTNIQAIGFTGSDYSHMPELAYYALLFTGEPQFNDAEMEVASNAAWNHYGFYPGGIATSIINGTSNAMGGVSNNGAAMRNYVIGGVNYYGASSNSPNGLRLMAWDWRDIGYACAIAGGYGSAATSVRQYICDIHSTIYAAVNAYIALLPAYAQAAGMFGEADLDSRNASWQTAYLHIVSGLQAGMTEDAGALTFTAYLAKWDKWVHDNFSTWMIPFYYGYVRIANDNTPAGNSSYNPYLTSTDGFCGLNDQIQATWTNGSNTFNLSHTDGGYAPANNDQIVWGTLGAGLQDPAPTNFSYYTTYFMKSVSGNNFELSATRGGASITPGNTLSAQKICLGAVGHPSTSTIYPGGGTGGGAMQSNTGSMNLAKAAGATVDATTLSDMNTTLQALPGWSGALATDGLKYSFQQSY